MKNKAKSVSILVAVCVVAIAVVLLLHTRIASNSPLLNLVLTYKYFTFRDSGVVPGRDGWLFYSEDVRGIVKPWPHVEENIASITSFADSLKKVGVELIVVPIPSPSEVLIDKYSPFAPVYTSNQKKRVIRRLRGHGVQVIDWTERFLAYDNRVALYNKKDAHWDYPGINLAAADLAEYIRNRIIMDTLVNYRTVDTVVYKYGSMVAQLAGDNERTRCECKRVVNSDGTPFKGTVRSQVMVFGDSYVNTNRGHHGDIGALLGFYLKAPTYSYSNLQSVINGPLLLMKRLGRMKNKPKIVIWMFASRRFIKKIK